MNLEGWIVLPWPPSANRYWRTWHGRTCKSTEAKRYQRDVADVVRGKVPLLSGGVILQLLFHPPDRRRRDLDNMLKVIIDALEGYVYENDSQVLLLVAARMDRIDKVPGLALVHAAELKQEGEP